MIEGIALVLLLVSFQTVLSSFTISIISPADLQNKFPSGIPGKLSLFGQFPYGSSVNGDVAVIPFLGCSRFQSPASGSIYLIASGNCPYSDKVWYAQQAGAKAVIIYNDQSAGLVDMTGRPSLCTIPSVFISSNDASAIMSAVTVIVTLQFSFAYSSSPSLSLVFALIEARDSVIPGIVSVLAEFATEETFKPYYNITICPDCTSFSSKVPNCLGGGRYCAYGASDGSLYLEEVMRQLCVFQLTTLSNQGSYNLFFNYLDTWSIDCSMDVTQVCAPALEHTGIKIGSLETCLSDATNGQDPAVAPNTLLDAALADFTALKPVDTPSVYVSGEVYHGELVDTYLQRALCTQSLSSLPTVCSLYNVTSTPIPTTPGSAAVCSTGCSSTMLSSGTCYSECNNTACNYGNWACRCALYCPPVLLANSVCDIGCNSSQCVFDGGLCFNSAGNDLSTNSSATLGWDIWLVISICVFVCM